MPTPSNRSHHQTQVRDAQSQALSRYPGAPSDHQRVTPVHACSWSLSQGWCEGGCKSSWPAASGENLLALLSLQLMDSLATSVLTQSHPCIPICFQGTGATSTEILAQGEHCDLPVACEQEGFANVCFRTRGEWGTVSQASCCKTYAPRCKTQGPRARQLRAQGQITYHPGLSIREIPFK